MESLLSNLSSLLAFLQQHFMPPFIFISLNALFFRPWLEKMGILPSDVFAKLGVFFIASLVVAYALDNLNLFIYDFFQGSPIKDRWLGKRLISRHQKKLGSLLEQISGLKKEMVELKKQEKKAIDEKGNLAQEALDLTAKISEKETTLQQIEADYSSLFGTKYPVSDSRILPTKFGNIIEAFKEYSWRRYGIDAKILMHRMQPVLALSGYEKIIRQQKVKVDFFLNMSVLSIFFVVECWIAAFHGRSVWLIVVSTLLPYLFYRLAMRGADEWGEAVKGAFDLYRYDLLKILRCQIPKRSFDSEKEMWQTISAFMKESYDPILSHGYMDYVRIEKEIQPSEKK